MKAPRLSRSPALPTAPKDIGQSGEASSGGTIKGKDQSKKRNTQRIEQSGEASSGGTIKEKEVRSLLLLFHLTVCVHICVTVYAFTSVSLCMRSLLFDCVSVHFCVTVYAFTSV